LTNKISSSLRKYFFSGLIILLVLGFPATPAGVAQTYNATVNINTTYQTMEGFGAAIAWYNSWLTDNPQKTEIYDLIFQDLGLDILRLRNTYGRDHNYSMDEDQEIVQAAQARNPNIKVMISSWTPPSELKSNDWLEEGTLKKVGGSFVYDEFADYWYDSLNAYAQKGVVPEYISIQNEPDYTATWESCDFRPSETTEFPGYGTALDRVYRRLQYLSNPPKIIGPETTGIGSNLMQNYAQQMDLSQVHGIAYHLYNGGDPGDPDSYNSSLRAIAAAYPNKPIFQTEFDWPTPFNSARLIHNVLVEGRACAYLHWALIWAPGEKGLVAVENPWESSGYSISDYYYVIKHFSKYISAGYKRVAASGGANNIKLSAYLAPDGNQLTLVIINTEHSTVDLALDLGAFTVGDSAVYQTAGGDKFAYAGSLGTGNRVNLPGQSISTVVVDKSTIPPTPTPTTSPEPTPTPTSTTEPTPTPTEGPTPTPTPTSSFEPGQVRVEARCEESNPNVQSLIRMNVWNEDTAALNNLSARYFVDLSEVYAAGYSAGNVTLDVYYSSTGVNVSPLTAYDTANRIYYYELDWGSYSVAPGARIEANFSIHLTGWQPAWDPANDWSYQGLSGSYTNTPYIPVYRAGELIYGLEPDGSPPPTPTPTSPVPTPTSEPTPTPTPTSEPEPTPTPTPTSEPEGDYVVDYVIVNEWGNGATIDVTITNNTSAAVNGWTLAWTFPGNQQISNLWGGSYTQTGASVSVTNLDWNADIAANGGSVNFGFNINYSGVNDKPTAFTLNGHPCQTR